ncbi:MAG: hypothetical protein CR997_06695 [Acidobacteria bacterium]|nr:MAG: hypothetical protein CR997_06695 [Acidobacteriota bacterium]
MRYPSALALIDEATYLLRRSPAKTYLSYYLGALPFVLGMVYYLTEMILSSMAVIKVMTSSLMVSGLYIWMKCWQSIFAAQLFARLVDGEPEKITFVKFFKLILYHMKYQPWKLIALPIGAILTVPFGWLFAYYQNLTVLPLIERSFNGQVAGKQSTLWWKQNHSIMLILWLFSLFVFLNFLILGFSIPQMLKTLMGIETTFSQAGFHLLNSSFLWACLGLTYLVIDPLLKAVYLLRCYYGRSQKNGQDLRADLRRLQKRIQTAIVLALFTGIALPVFGNPVNDEQQSGQRVFQAPIDPQKLNREIEAVLAQREYDWKRPKMKLENEDSFFASLAKTTRIKLRQLGKWLEKWMRKLLRKKPNASDHDSPSILGGRNVAYVLLITVTVLLCFLVVFLIRRQGAKMEPEPRTVSAPDLNREELVASDLPEDEWFKMANEMVEKGEYRLAVRAYFLSTLSLLNEKEIIRVEMFKSNYEYGLELSRREHVHPHLPSPFFANVALFEKVWYGMYDVSQGLLKQFLDNYRRIRNHAEPS